MVKTGFTFAGWNTAADGSGTNYAAGANYTADASVTLYAKWTAMEGTAMADKVGCTDKDFTITTKAPCQGCTKEENYTLLKSKWIPAGSRACEQFAIFMGCGCTDDNEIGFIKPLVVRPGCPPTIERLNPPDPYLVCDKDNKIPLNAKVCEKRD